MVVSSTAAIAVHISATGIPLHHETASFRTGGSPFLGLLACRPIMAQSVAPQNSTSPPVKPVLSAASSCFASEPSAMMLLGFALTPEQKLRYLSSALNSDQSRFDMAAQRVGAPTA